MHGMTCSDDDREAFVEDSKDLASRLAQLGEELPQQIAKGRTTVRVCKEWMGKPLSGADAVMAEGKQADSANNKAAYARQAKLASALRARQ